MLKTEHKITKETLRQLASIVSQMSDEMLGASLGCVFGEAVCRWGTSVVQMHLETLISETRQ